MKALPPATMRHVLEEPGLLGRGRAVVPASPLPAEPAADADVTNSQRLHRLYRIDVAQIDDDRRSEACLDAGEIEGPELVPFGDNDSRICSIQAGVGAVGELDARQERFRRSNAFRIVGDDVGARRLQFRHDDEARRVAHVVAVLGL